MADWRRLTGRIVTDSEGAVGGVSVTVYQAGTTTKVTLKDNKAGTEALANPFETDAYGIWAFFIDTETLVSCDFELDFLFAKSGLDFSEMNEMYENTSVIGGTTGTGEGLSVHAAVACATTANISLTGEQTLDGILTSTDRVLVKDQTDATENGIYVSAAGAWARATDFDEDDEAADSFVFVTDGTTLGATGWVCTCEPDAQEIGVDDITFAQYSSVGYITAGTGLTKTGNELAVDGVLEDLDTLGAPASDGQFIVATEADVFAYESGATARASLTAAKSAVNADITGLTALATQAAVQINPFGVGAGETGEIRFLELAGGGTAYVGFKAPDGLAGNVIWTLPTTDSTGTQALVSDGSLALSWASITGVTPVGTPVDNQIAVWKTATSIEGDANLYWNATKLDITGDLYVDGTNVQLDGSTSVRLVSANFIALRSPENRIGFDTDDYMQIVTTENTGATAITHTGTAPDVTWTADSLGLTGNFSVDGTTVLLDGSTSVRTLSAGYVGLEATDVRIGYSDHYTKLAVADTTGNLTITHVGGNTDLVTWTAAGGFDLVGPFTLSATPAIGLTISGACTSHAISISAAQSGSGLHVGDTWKLGFADGAINIGGDATIAFGTTVSDSICIQRVDVSAGFDTTDKYLIAKYQTLATSGANTGTNIWMGDYTKITIAHNTTDVYGMRGRVDLTDTLSGNMMVGLMGSVTVTGAFTCAATGGVKGVEGAIYTSGSGTINGYVAAGWFDMSGCEINCAGKMTAVWARVAGSGYADHLVYLQVQNNLLQDSVICVDATDSAVIPVGLKFLETVGAITAEIMLTAGNYIMSGSADPNGAVSGVDGSFYLRTGTATATTIGYVCTGTTNWTALGGGAGGGDVYVTGTPVDNQLAIWTAADHIEGVTALTYDGSTKFRMTGGLFIKEQAEATANEEAYGEIWVDTATPNLLMFTDDADTDFWLNRTAGIADTNQVVVDDASVADDDFARFTATGIEGLTVAETITALLAAALPENVSIRLDPVLSADTKWSGITEDGTAGTTALVYGYCYYLASTGKWELAKADAVATSINKLGMCVVAANTDATGTLLLYGKIRADDEFPAFTVGAPVHISAATAGLLASAAPTGTTDFVVRIVGKADTADSLFFSPDQAYVTLV